jgi:hypothetical protein
MPPTRTDGRWPSRAVGRRAGVLGEQRAPATGASEGQEDARQRLDALGERATPLRAGTGDGSGSGRSELPRARLPVMRASTGAVRRRRSPCGAAVSGQRSPVAASRDAGAGRVVTPITDRARCTYAGGPRVAARRRTGDGCARGERSQLKRVGVKTTSVLPWRARPCRRRQGCEACHEQDARPADQLLWSHGYGGPLHRPVSPRTGEGHGALRAPLGCNRPAQWPSAGAVTAHVGNRAGRRQRRP